MIPKNIYITHETYEHLFNYENKIKKTMINNPNYKVIFYNKYNRNNFIKKYYPTFYEYYSKINDNYGAMKADIFRVLILHKFGGVYIDIKSVLYNIDPLFKKYPNKDFFTVSYNEELLFELIHKIFNCKYLNYFIATRANGKIITKIKDVMYKRLQNYYNNDNNNIFKRGTIGVFYLTGPSLFTTIINKNKDDIINISEENTKYSSAFDNTGMLNRFIKDRRHLTKSYHFSINKIFK